MIDRKVIPLGEGTPESFLIEAKRHLSEADRNGSIAFKAFLWAAGLFAIFAINIERSWCWWFYWTSLMCGLRMFYAIKERWFHRGAARISYAFHLGIYD